MPPPEAPTVCVFAPSPLLTITLEASARAGEDELHVHAGGQGFWVARMLACLGVDVVLCGSFGGELGRISRWVIEQHGITVAATEAQARNGGYVHDRRDGSRLEIGRSYCDTLDRHDVDSLYGTTLVEGLRASVTVLTGPSERSILPDDVYRRLASDIGSNGGRVVADLSGNRLAAALRGGVMFAKVSEDELRRDGELAPDEPAEVGLVRLADRGATHLAVSCAAEGAYALVDDRSYRLTAPEFVPFDTRGAGDAMSATIAASIAWGEPLLDAVRRGVAAGALNVTRRGLGSGVARQISRIVDLVEVHELQPTPTPGDARVDAR